MKGNQGLPPPPPGIKQTQYNELSVEFRKFLNFNEQLYIRFTSVPLNLFSKMEIFLLKIFLFLGAFNKSTCGIMEQTQELKFHKKNYIFLFVN